MTMVGFLQLALYMVVLLLCVKPLGLYMANVYEGKSRVNRVFAPVERGSIVCLGRAKTWK